MAIFPGSAIPSAADAAYTIDNSLRFATDGALSRDFLTEGNRRTYTLSVWIKRALLEHDSEQQVILSTGESGSEPSGGKLTYIYFKGE